MRISARSIIVFGLLVLLTHNSFAQWTWTPQTKRWINIKQMPKETAQLQIEYGRSLLLQGEYKKAMDECNKFDKFYMNDALADENQYLRAEIYQGQGKLYEAATAYQQVISGYPGTTLVQDAIARQYEIGDTFFSEGQIRIDERWHIFRKRPLRRAAEVYAMVVKNQPFDPQSAQAEYKIGLCQFTRGDYLEAANTYRTVTEEYRSSEWVDEAVYGIAMCYYNLSLPSDYDQTSSQLTMASIDEFAGRYPSDGRVTDLRNKQVEMSEVIAEQRLKAGRFYVKRREFNAAHICFEELVNQYPDTRSAADAQAWLEQNPRVLTEAQQKVNALREAS
jgi:outer membrane assembly lipoprotein YfiO